MNWEGGLIEVTILNTNFANGRMPRIFQNRLAKFDKFAPFALKNSSVEGSKIVITYKLTTTKFGRWSPAHGIGKFGEVNMWCKEVH